MPQVSLYLDDATMTELRASSALAGMSISRYVAHALKTHHDNGGWPEGWWDIYGMLDDTSFKVPDDLTINPNDSLTMD